ncbi:MAG TPA: NmrA/HSCARG family protein [Usitatibacter sp.]|jgi:uncharacterized protein YbjT (DUF2867 family)|nr:NmrA/HSCARG family protein [Usitatibacter sp.]
MSSSTRKTIAVFGATGHQGGAAVRALQAQGTFRVRALTRDPGKHRGLAEEVVEADLGRPGTLRAALEGAYGVFLVTNAWGGGDERAQAESAVRAAKDAGVRHLVWSTLPNAQAISGGSLPVAHFSNKAKVDGVVRDAAFEHHTFVMAPFYYQNLARAGAAAPQKLPDGSTGWALPMDPNAGGIAMGDIEELGPLVAGAFAQPARAGQGQYLPLVADTLGFGDIVETLNRQGHAYSFTRVPREVFSNFFPGAEEMAQMFEWFEKYTYLGGAMTDRIALAREIAGKKPTAFAPWARQHLPVAASQPERSQA